MIANTNLSDNNNNRQQTKKLLNPVLDLLSHGPSKIMLEKQKVVNNC